MSSLHLCFSSWRCCLASPTSLSSSDTCCTSLACSSFDCESLICEIVVSDHCFPCVWFSSFLTFSSCSFPCSWVHSFWILSISAPRASRLVIAFWSCSCRPLHSWSSSSSRPSRLDCFPCNNYRIVRRGWNIERRGGREERERKKIESTCRNGISS